MKKLLSWLLIIFGISSMIIAVIWQTILRTKSLQYGGNIYLVNHWSLYLMLGIIPFLIGFYMIMNKGEKKE